MIDVLRKEWGMVRPFVPAVLVFWLVLQLAASEHAAAFWGCAVFLSLCAAAALFILDDRRRTLSLIAALPVSRAEMVVARYIAVWTILLAGFGIALGVGWFAFPFLRQAGHFVEWINPTSVLSFTGVVLFTSATAMPLLYRFGTGGGITAWFVSMLCCGLLWSLVGLLLPAPPGSAFPAGWRLALWLGRSLGDVLGGAGAAIALLLLLALLQAASLLVSIAVFRRRDL